ncbi:translocation/assembly module TamB domain-containing protein [Undibacterium fentianense]|uniref:Translocation/assembly module TamB domain-containing protein n=1 Tax=Undibacterium fentianense TaxID=2828728 RepID=A0A941IHL3_9BURK|nr:translocation/assembly module TamB domain-containing protein [Undibacterium fentianense]MBR7801090.1 translocation/assembly module TamB domain-containing protein [Undibacterium fentianense]
MTKLNRTKRIEHEESKTQSVLPTKPYFGYRMFVRIGISFGLLCVLLVVLLHTQLGGRIALRSIELLSAGQLQFGQMRGQLANHVEIDQINYVNSQHQINLHSVELDWNAWLLLRKQLFINSLKIASVEIAHKKSNTSSSTPEYLGLPFQLNLDKLAIGRIQLAEFQKNDADSQVTQPYVYARIAGITAHWQGDSHLHQIQLRLNSEWGDVKIQQEWQTRRPFVTQGNFIYSGRAESHLPKLLLEGEMSGSLERLLLKANSVLKAKDGRRADPEQQAKIDLDLVLAPFLDFPLEAARANIATLNPQWIHSAAPNAMLDLEINLNANNSGVGNMPQKVNSVSQHQFKKQSIESDHFVEPLVEVNKVRIPGSKPTVEAGTASSTRNDRSANSRMTASSQSVVGQPKTGWSLDGFVHAKNHVPATLDQKGLPLRTLYADIKWNQENLTLQNARIDLNGGQIQGHSMIEFRSTALPLVTAQLKLQDINLLNIDSRLRESRIQGQIQLQTKTDRSLDFQAQFTEPRGKAEVEASFRLNAQGDNGVLHLKKMTLQADEARLDGQGKVDFDQTKNFELKATLNRFDPAHWWLAPKGKLDGAFELSGNFGNKTRLKLNLPSLSGELAGQPILAHGMVDWHDKTALAVQEFDLNWGANQLSLKGGLGKVQDSLEVNLKADQLSLLETFGIVSMRGKANLKANLRGKLDALSGEFQAHGADLMTQKGIYIGQIDGDGEFGLAPTDALKFNLVARQIRLAQNDLSKDWGTHQPHLPNDPVSTPIMHRFSAIEQLKVNLNGSRNSHQIELRTQFDQTRNLQFRANGSWQQIGNDLRSKSAIRPPQTHPAEIVWHGNVQEFVLSGFLPKNSSYKEDLRLLEPTPLRFTTKGFGLGQARFEGVMGQVRLEQFDWSPLSYSTRGQWDALPVMPIVDMFRPAENLHGDLQLGAQWDVQLQDHLRGMVRIQRQQGDLTVSDLDGTGQLTQLGLRELSASFHAGGLVAGSDAERVRMQFMSRGSKLGQWDAELATQLQRINDRWTWNSDMPISGEIHASVPELQWLANQLSADFTAKGALKLDAKFNGSTARPEYNAKLEGHGLELAFASEGLLFPNGELHAELNQDTLKLQQLRFTSKVNLVPKLEQFQDLNWLGREGEFNASGEVSWKNQNGAIHANWKAFPLLQRKDRWLVVSGQADITQSDRIWSLIGKLGADAAYFKLPKMPPPSLSGDVVVTKSGKVLDEDLTSQENKKVWKTKLDLQIDMGPRFVFVGRGLDTALTGTMRLRSSDGAPVHASGSIVTNGGQYEGYGQKLEIERGILNFQGTPGNPSLNIRALRKGLAVEAGVDVTGTVARPQVRLVSEPNVPDSEKISWLVLGRESEQVGTADASLLLSAAGALFGGDGSRNLPRELVQGLGFDEFSIGPAENGGASKLPSQTVAGAIAVGAASNDKVVNIGKRLRPGLVLSVERGVSDASGALKLSWQLSRRIRFVGRSGTDNSADVRYSFSFN